MIAVRRSGERGHADHGWLRTFHTFSFADYLDRRFMGFRSLRVINEDFVAPARGFGTHPHSDMEILTYILEGELEHRDSMGNGSVIRPHDVQRMTAGTGVTHSEQNPSREHSTHLLQIWILPRHRGSPPGYEQKTFSVDEKRDRLRLVASGDARQGSVRIDQDVDLYASVLSAGCRLSHPLRAGRGAWLQVARGSVSVGDQMLEQGDGAAVEGEDALEMTAKGEAEILLFDLG